MEDQDAKWIEENVNDPIQEEEGNFEGSFWMSTDGKHSVSVKATTREGRKAGLAWATAVYKKLIYTFGTKQAQAVKEYKAAENGNDVRCETCGEPATARSGVKNGRKWSGIFCSSENKSHTKWS